MSKPSMMCLAMLPNLLKTMISALFLCLPFGVAAQDWALGGYDPVTYLTQNSAIPGRGNITTGWRGKEYHFASDENRALFEANPRAYTPGFDGLCVVAMSKGQVIPGDPQQFVIIGQRVYLVGTEADKELLLSNPRELLMKAKSNWVKR
ncbi:MAG: YHS domain-containing (seleno)protein [Paracoccus sp. (in: a-proteobacteria)]